MIMRSRKYRSHRKISFILFVEVKDSKHEVDRHRIAALVKKYVKMFKGLRLIATNRESDLWHVTQVGKYINVVTVDIGSVFYQLTIIHWLEMWLLVEFFRS